MSFENQTTPVAANMNVPPTKKSGGPLKWILGGCGCLGLIAAICFGGFFYFAITTAGAISQEARTLIESSSVVQEQLGSPITIVSETPPAQQGQGSLVLEFDVEGPEGAGTATVTAKMDPETFKFVIEDSSLEVDGETFDLNVADEFKELEVEGLEDF